MKKHSFLLWGFALFLSFVISFAMSSSGLSADKDFPVPKECMDQVRKEGNRLNIYDWAEWWPEEIYEGFSKEFGVKITRDNFASEDELLTKFKLNPKAQYDLALAGTRIFLQLKELDILQKLNHDWIPNVNQYLPEETKNAWYDPGYNYTAETERYFVGYAYNTKYVDPKDPRIPSWKLLFEGEDYKGRMTMIEGMYIVIGSALKYLGFSYNSDDESELMKAREVLLRQKPWVMAYDAWPKRLVLEEEAYITHCWIGEAWFYHQDMETIRGALPPEGTMVGTDSLVIPKHAPHPAAAHLFINYLFRPKVNATLIEGIGYAPNHTVTASLLPEEMREWPGVQPSTEFLGKCEFISPKAFTGRGLELRTKIWEELKQ